MKDLLTILTLALLFTTGNLCGQSTASISIDVIDKSTNVLTRDEPLFLSIIIVNDEAQRNYRWNNKVHRALAELNDNSSESELNDSNYEKEKVRLENAKRNIPQDTFCAENDLYSCFKLSLQNKDSIKKLSFVPVDVRNSEGGWIIGPEDWIYSELVVPPQEFSDYGGGTYVIELSTDESISNSLEITLKEEDELADSLLAEVELNKAKYFRLNGQNGESIRLLESLVVERPTDIAAHVLLSEIYLENEDHENAMHHVEKAINLYYTINSTAADPPILLLELIGEIEAMQE